MRTAVGWAVLGGAVFLGAQLVLFWTMGGSAGSESAGWFLNSGRGVGTMAAIVAASTALAGGVRRTPMASSVGAFTLGAAMAMAGVLFVIGPGSIFPIVVFAGALVIALAALAGSLVSYGVNARVRRRPR